MPVVMLLGGVLACVVGLVVVGQSMRRATVGFGLVLLAFATGAVLARSPSIAPGGARISLTDVVSSVILAAAVGRIIRTRISGPQALLLLLMLISGASLIRGVRQNGPEAAINEFRTIMRYFGAVLYFSTIRVSPQMLDRLGRVWTWLAVGLTAVLALRWMNRLLGIPIGIFDAVYDAPIRVLDGPQSFFYAEALFIAMPATALLSGSDRRSRLGLAAFFLALNLALNRRTALAALLAAGLALMVHNRGFRRHVGPIALAAGILAGTALFFSPAEEVDEGLGQSATDTGTLEWRIDGWTDLLTQHIEAGPTAILFGQPMGSGYERTANDQTVESNPHSWYVQVFLRSGIVGLLALAWLYVRVLLTLRQRASRQETAPPSYFDFPTVWALLIAELVWFTTWEPHLVQGLVLGLAVAVVAQRERLPAVRAGGLPLAH